MQITVAAFLSGGPDIIAQYSDFIKASRTALSVTNPGARYVVLTDACSVPLIAPLADVCVCADLELPLMPRIIKAQAKFCSLFRGDILVLPDIDCIANKDLSVAIPPDVGMATTHKGEKFNYRINNLAYIRDAGLGQWFLERALDILLRWPVVQLQWWGDQDAWGAALGSEMKGIGAWVFIERVAEEVFVARPERGKEIWLYPCQTHNCFFPDDGNVRPEQEKAFMVHFKGSRKRHLAGWMARRFP
jgi:hypothetical protein